MVLIRKGPGDYRVIGLVEVMWKVVIVILGRRFTAYIAFHDVFSGFWAGYGMDTASLKAKLPQQLAAMMEEIFYTIFLDLHKVYEALGWDRCLNILEVYGVVPWSRRILQEYWDRL